MHVGKDHMLIPYHVRVYHDGKDHMLISDHILPIEAVFNLLNGDKVPHRVLNTNVNIDDLCYIQ